MARQRRVAVIVAAGFAVALAACELLSTLPAFVDVRIVNDTNAPVAVASCYRAHCIPCSRAKPCGALDTSSDEIAAGASRDEATWANERAGHAVYIAREGARVLGCLLIPFAKGQQHATITISEAVPLRSRRCRPTP